MLRTIRSQLVRHQNNCSGNKFIMLNNRFTKMSTNANDIVSKEQLQDLITSQNEHYILIDVRNPDEVASSAPMPLIDTAVNIPLPDLGSAFMMMDDTRFKNQYGFLKPKSDERIIVYCRSGVRSAQAAAILEEMDYNNVQNYKGSALDWYGK